MRLGKLLFLLIIVLVCTGCARAIQRNAIEYDSPYSLVCIDGVTYLESYYKLSPKWLADEEGRPYLVKCENK